jgi:nucleoside-diphosphate-sugar epimerase
MIVVFGAFGRSGRVVAETLKKASVRLVTRQAGRRSAEPAAEVVRANLADEVELGRVVKGARALYALLPDDFTAQSFHAGRRALAENIARAIRREQIGRVVLLSSSSASLGERGGNGLGADLAYFERVVLETNAAVSVLRASYFQDNVLEALPMAEHEGVYANLMPSRETPVVTIAAQDVGAFAAAALLEPARAASEIVDLVGPTYSPNRMALQLGDAVGRTLSIVDVPAAGQEAMLRQWMSRDAARAMVETLACLASGRIVLAGDRVARGQTRLEQVLRAALSRRPAPEVQP